MIISSIGDTFDLIRNGKSIQQNGDEGFPITRIETIADGYIDKERFGYAGITNIDEYKDFLLKKDDILMSHINSEKHLGKVAIYDSEEPLIHGMNLLNLRPSRGKILGRFAYYYFCSDFFKFQIPRITKKSVNQASFNVSSLKELQIPIPPLPIQKEIVQVLDKAQELIDFREQQLKLLDDLVQSVFYDMFGDPVTNPKGWETTRLEEVVFLQRGHDLPVDCRNQNGNINVYGSNGILGKHNEAKVLNGGVITGRSGTIGLVEYTFESYWPLNTTLFSKDLYGNNIVYIAYLLSFFKLARFYNGTGVPTLNRNIIHKEEVYKIPISLQNEFAEKVQKIEAQKALMQESLQQMKDNYNSLMQRAFRGELFPE